MGKFTNTRRSNIFGFAALILMSAAAIALVYFQFIT